MAEKKKAVTKVTESYGWNPKTTDAVLASALKTLSGRYPALTTKKGTKKLLFVKGGEASECGVSVNGDKITITYNKVNMALRMVGAVISGTIADKPDFCPFEMFGVMIDCSRNSVMTVDYLKKYFDRLAILGYNMVMLYTEDTYEIEGEPFFGAMRGAYSPTEIKEIDDYAAKLGIELIPCIQTLAHLEQIFRWKHYEDINDLGGVLLVDEPKTYELIEKMLIMWKGCVRTRRIHVGMDEAHGVGTGKFRKLHGNESVFSILTRHLTKVVELCDKHGFKPMMWSDMFFRAGSKTNDYYDKESVIPKKVAKQIPKEIELVYWDYYHEEKETYDHFIKRHRELGGEPIMGSGVWTWNKFWYDHFYTHRTVGPCIEACREAKVKDVFFTMWGDRGGFCDYDSSFAGLAYSAELAFTGTADDAVLEKKFTNLFNGASYKNVITLANCGYMNFPQILWDDPVMQLGIGSFIGEAEARWKGGYNRYDFKSSFEDIEKAVKVLASAGNCGDAGDMAFAKALANAVYTKMLFVKSYLDAYQGRNRKQAVTKVIPILKEYKKHLEKFNFELHAMWFRNNKPQGFESIQIKQAGQLERTKEAIRRFEELADGKVKSIPETDSLLKIYKDLKLEWAPWQHLAQGTTIV